MQNTSSPTILNTKAKDKKITHQACNTLVHHAYDNYLNLTPNNIPFATKQTILSQYGQINTIKKNKKDNNHKDKKKSKKEKQDVGSLAKVGSPTKNS
jgi:hypothetical protein